MLDVSRPLTCMNHFALIASDLAQDLHGLIQANLPTGGEVHAFTGNLSGWSGCSENISFHDVVNVSEIAALFAVAVNRWLVTAKHSGAELRQHARVLRCRILVRAKDIEVAQGDGF